MRDIEAGEGFFRSPALARLEWLAHDAIVVDPLAWQADPLEAMRRGAAELGLRNDFHAVCGKQTHGDGVAVVDGQFPLFRGVASRVRLPQTDAIIVCSPGILAAVATADCAPIILADADRRLAAVVHAGWRGTRVRVLEKAIRRLASMGSRPKDLRLWVGPCIRQRNYEVSEDLAGQFAGEFPEVSGALNGRRLDLAAINLWQARRMGVLEENLFDSAVCVFDDRRFPSYRREGERAGRLLIRAALRG